MMKKTLLVLVLTVAVAVTATAQMVGATNRQNPQGMQTTGNSQQYHPTGPALRFEAGMPHFITAAYVYHINSNVMVGGGAGLGALRYKYFKYQFYKPANSNTYSPSNEWLNNYYDVFCMPVFLETELHTPRYKWSLFLNVKLGYNLFRPEDHYDKGHRLNDYGYSYSDITYDYEYIYDPFFISATAGVSYKNLSLGVGYSTSLPVCAYISFNLPISTLSNAFSGTFL